MLGASRRGRSRRTGAPPAAAAAAASKWPKNCPLGGAAPSKRKVISRPSPDEPSRRFASISMARLTHILDDAAVERTAVVEEPRRRGSVPAPVRSQGGEGRRNSKAVPGRVVIDSRAPSPLRASELQNVEFGEAISPRDINVFDCNDAQRPRSIPSSSSPPPPRTSTPPLSMSPNKSVAAACPDRRSYQTDAQRNIDKQRAQRLALDQQIQEKRAMELQAKVMKQTQEREALSLDPYDPWGRQGGGAPTGKPSRWQSVGDIAASMSNRSMRDGPGPAPGALNSSSPCRASSAVDYQLQARRSRGSTIVGGAHDSEAERRAMQKSILKEQIEERRMLKMRAAEEQERITREEDARVEQERLMLEKRWDEERRRENMPKPSKVDVLQAPSVVAPSVKEGSTHRAPTYDYLPAPRVTQSPARAHGRDMPFGEHGGAGAGPMDNNVFEDRRIDVTQPRRVSERRDTAPAPVQLSSRSTKEYDELSRMCQRLMLQQEDLREQLMRQTETAENDRKANEGLSNQVTTLQAQIIALTSHDRAKARVRDHRRKLSSTSPPAPPKVPGFSFSKSLPKGSPPIKLPPAAAAGRPSKRPSWASRSKAGQPATRASTSVAFDTSIIRGRGEDAEQELGCDTTLVFPGDQFWPATSGGRSGSALSQVLAETLHGRPPSREGQMRHTSQHVPAGRLPSNTSHLKPIIARPRRRL